MNIDEETRKKLEDLLLKLNQTRKDFQGNGSPVQDIIDPDLGPYILPQPAKIEEDNVLEADFEPDDDEEYRRKFLPPPKSKQHPYINARRFYSWIPTEFEILPSGKVKIKGRIHNLPPTDENAELYTCIRKAFEAMVPLWNSLNLLKKSETTTLQVIVKAQAYCLPPQTSYAGRWHVEGLTENIVASGVYYVRIDPHLIGGNLKFRQKKGPSPPYTEYGLGNVDYQVEVEQGNAVAFSNALPHRFRKIENSSKEKEGYRLFLNFFIVDPDQKLKSTSDLLSKSMLTTLLKKASNDAGLPIPKEIMKVILKYVPGVWPSKFAMTKFRKEARNKMKTMKSGWGWINWGNCGTSQFVLSRDLLHPIREEDMGNIRHTESDPSENIEKLPQ